ncbi:MAG: hypothetical protein KatS3mg109_1787 [Pirellulaceae bacterium]|nr:MAG: hypothetical protein KatS3mg109_1787 [Pirellulaceae bacterium]
MRWWVGKLALWCVLLADAVLVARVAPSRLWARDPMSFDDLDTLLDLDPYLPIPPIRRLFPPEVVPVWNDALTAPDIDLRRRAAETIAQAVSLGMPGLEVTAANLQKLAASDEEPVTVRLAAARALVQLDARSCADAVWQVLQAAGMDRASFLVVPLGRWGYRPAARPWTELVADPQTLSYQVVLALQGLGELAWQEAAPVVRRRLVDAAQPRSIRLAAARSLARLVPDEAARLGADWSRNPAADPFSRLLAAELLQTHTQPEFLTPLETLAQDGDPAVANLALKKLYELDLERVARLSPQISSSPDSSVRRWAVRALGHFPSVEHVELLAGVLDDPHPQLRALARDQLLAFAEQPPLRDAVIGVAVLGLEQEDWRLVEQAARIAGRLKYRPAARQLATLIEMPRLEASVTAAWALRRLEVPDVLPEVLERATRLSETGMRRANTVDLDPLLSQVFQYFGLMNFRDAEPLLKRFLPKNSMSPEARAAAIWALGRFYAGQPDENLVKVLVERLSDVNSQPPEHDRVRQLCAVSLGRMRAESALPALRRFYQQEGSNMPTGLACGWAIHQITGESYQPPSQLALFRQGWFLVPWK